MLEIIATSAMKGLLEANKMRMVGPWLWGLNLAAFLESVCCLNRQGIHFL
jgi:hypothetical protein